MSKDYRKKNAGTSTTGQMPVCVVPDVVSVAMDEVLLDGSNDLV